MKSKLNMLSFEGKTVETAFRIFYSVGKFLKLVSDILLTVGLAIIVTVYWYIIEYREWKERREHAKSHIRKAQEAERGGV